jgi:hypothetical protein
MPYPSVERHLQKKFAKSDHTRIAERAYGKWLEAGRPQGDGREFWLAAELELTRAHVTLEEIEEIAGEFGKAMFNAAHTAAKEGYRLGLVHDPDVEIIP